MVDKNIMNILIINRQYAGGGGAEAAVRGLTKLLITQKHDITILTLGHSHTIATQNHTLHQSSQPQTITYHTVSNYFSEKLKFRLYHDRGIEGKIEHEKPIDLGDKGVVHSRRPFFNIIFLRLLAFVSDWLTLAAPFWIYRLIQRLHPDIVHTHNLRGMGMLLPLAIRLARWRYSNRKNEKKIRWYHTCHDIQLVEPSGIALYPAFEKHVPNIHDRAILGYAFLQKCVWGSPDVVISPSQFLIDFYRRYRFFKSSEIKVIPNLIHLSKKEFQSDQLETTNQPHKYILFAGAIEESKGIRVLLDAYSLFQKNFQRKEVPPLHIVGDGSLLPQLKQAYFSKKIIFHGLQPAQSMSHMYREAIVTVLPSLTYENAPTVIMESMREGIPVIASRIGGIPELVQEGITGLLFTPGKSRELRDALTSFIGASQPSEFRMHCQREAIARSTQSTASHTLLYME